MMTQKNFAKLIKLAMNQTIKEALGINQTQRKIANTGGQKK